MRPRYLTFAIFFLLICSPVLVLAQQLDCTPQVKQALVNLGQNCANLGRNSACYGNSLVSATFSQPVTADYFTKPSDKAELTFLKTIQTAKAISQNQYGIAVLNVDADLPDAAKLPGQAVKILLLGDAQVESGIKAGDTTQTPMQALFLRTNFSGSSDSCKQEQAPTVVAVQSPPNQRINLTINGAAVNMGSTAMFRILPPGNTIQMVTIEGSIALDQGTPNQVVVSGGFSTVRCLDGAKNLGIDAVPNDQEVIPGCPWTAPIPGTQQEYEIAQVVLGAFAALNGQLCPNGGQNIIHTVKSGQNLFRIAQAYGTTVAAIVKENNITNAQSIYNGQQLKISCALNTGRSPFAPALPVNPGPATGPFIPPGFPSGPPSLPSGPLSSMPSVPFSVTPGP